MPRKTLTERFWAKVNKTADCWLWTKGKSGQRYGSFDCDGKTLRAHRVSWVLHFGPIPDNLCVCHKCDTPLCVRPDHLFLGTNLDNVRDREKKKRRKPPQGEKHGNAKLTLEDVMAIRQSCASTKEIALRYNIHRDSVSRIIRRKAWPHIS